MKPPFRADHVGSLLRPQDLHDARAKNRKGELSDAKLKETQDKDIREVLKLQEAVGIQSVTDDGVFFTDSHDVSGQDRSQILDRDWQVCTQDPPAGSKITPDTKIDFGVVRVDTEDCP